MKKVHWRVWVGAALVLLTLVLGMTHFLVFGDGKTLLYYLGVDIVFIPIQVLLVSLIIEQFLDKRERESIRRKLSMTIGAFFSEVGCEQARRITGFCDQAKDLRERLSVGPAWSVKDYRDAAAFARTAPLSLSLRPENFRTLRDLALAKREFILGLLQNPNLSEHEDFSDMMLAVCHLTEELEARRDLAGMPPTDEEHLKKDMERAYRLLIREWLGHMQHLQAHYPYIHSLLVRTNPFSENASPVIRG